MARIPLSTDTFKYFNANPHNRRTSDCAVRALSLALGCSWEEALTGLYLQALSSKTSVSDPSNIARYLKQCGWTKMPAPREDGNHRVRAYDFAKTVNGVVIANLGSHHIAVIKEHKVWDIWDSSHQVVGNYWVKL